MQERPSNPRRGRGLLGFLVALALLVPWVTANGTPLIRAQAQAQPNIVLILTDDLDTRSLDEAIDRLPNLVALRGQGASFTNAIVTTPNCCPSRASILRGQYAHNHGVLRNSGPDGGFTTFQTLGREDSTVGIWLQDAGYRTALLGKYLNGYPDGVEPTYAPPGWDEWYVSSEHAYFDYTLNENGRLVEYGSDPEDYVTDVLSARAADFIARSAAANDPFLVFLAPQAPHGPATPAPRHAGAFAGAVAPRVPSFDETDVGDKPRYISSLAPLGGEQIARMDELHRARLQTLLAVDEMVGALVETLWDAGELDDTYIVFTSDNGSHLGEHRLPSRKGTPYEEAIQVPMLVRGPGVPAGAVIDALAANIDLAPTFAELAGAPEPSFVDGRSLVPLLRGETPPAWRQAVLVEDFGGEGIPRLGGLDTASGSASQEVDATGGEDPGSRLRWAAAAQGETEEDDSYAGPRVPGFRALRMADRLYVEYATGEQEVYDLLRDPYELSNLASGEDVQPAELARLSERLAALRDCVAEACRAEEDAPLTGAGDERPIPTIVEPAGGTLFRVGQAFVLRGEATDAAGQPLPDSALTWEVVLRHGTHTHPVLPPTVGNGLPFTALGPEDPTAAGTSHLEIRLTATDGAGRRRTVVRELLPNRAVVVFLTEPAGLTLRVNGTKVTGPTGLRLWEGYKLRLEAPDQLGPDRREMAWVDWSDGGAATHVVTTPGEKGVLRATFLPTTADLTFAPDADAHVLEVKSKRNYGDEREFIVGGGAKSYLRFVVEGLPGAVRHATLRVHVAEGTDAGALGEVAIRAADSGWTESELAWKNSPAHSDAVLDSGGDVVDGWVEFDVTPALAGEGTYSFVLLTPSRQEVAFSAREGRDPAELLVTVALPMPRSVADASGETMDAGRLG